MLLFIASENVMKGLSQLEITCSKLALKTPEQDKKNIFKVNC